MTTRDTVMVTRSTDLTGNKVWHKYNASRRQAACGVPFYKSRDLLLATIDVLTLGLHRPCQRCNENAPRAYVGPGGVRSAHKAEQQA